MHDEYVLNPLVSVIIPVYNRSELLPRTIKSTVTQTYRNLEIIIVDDSSEEDIRTIVNGFNDNRLRYLRRGTNGGVSEARNTGIKAAKGEFIQFLDSDDEFLPEKIEKQLEIFKKSKKEDLGFVYCGAWMETNCVLKEISLNQPGFCKWAFLIHQVLIKSRVVEKTGFFDTAFSMVEDTDYIFRMGKTCKFCGISEPLVIYHNTHGSTSKNTESIIKYTNLFIDKHKNILLPEEKILWYKYIAKRCLSIGKTTEAYKFFLKAYISCPKNIYFLRKLLRLSPVFLFHLLKSKKRGQG